MNRWQAAFENCAFKSSWDDLREKVISIDEEKECDEESFLEVARLKKSVSYVDLVLNGLDFEIFPVTRFGSLHQNCASVVTEVNNFINNKVVTHVRNANDKMDSILNIVILFGGGVHSSEEVVESDLAYKESLSNSISGFLDDLKNKSKYISECYERIKEFNSTLFDEGKNEEIISIKKAINNFLDESEVSYSKITALHKEIFEGGADSIQSQIEKFKSDAQKESENTRKAAAAVSTELEEIDSYYIQVMGEESEEGVRSGGLKDELHRLLNNLNDFEKKQKVRYHALNDEIQSALPGATRAGLAKAYSDMRKTFDQPIYLNSIFFYLSLSVLVGLSLFFLVDKVDDKLVVVTFSSVSDAFINLLQKLPIIVPLVWVAVFSAKRRSEYLRLQQEYAHKEALSFSYQNFKEQIDKLNSESKEEMLDKLLISAIYAVSSNASETLDKRHEENSPIHDLFSQLLSSMWGKGTDKDGGKK